MGSIIIISLALALGTYGIAAQRGDWTDMLC